MSGALMDLLKGFPPFVILLSGAMGFIWILDHWGSDSGGKPRISVFFLGAIFAVLIPLWATFEYLMRVWPKL